MEFSGKACRNIDQAFYCFSEDPWFLIVINSASPESLNHLKLKTHKPRPPAKDDPGEEAGKPHALIPEP